MISLRSVLFLLLFLIVVFLGTAQTPETKFKPTDIIPPTPNAMKMTEYQSQRPNMYTGTANVSIPLYTIDFDGWKLPLSISYNATGIRANEEASEVGLGWALNATGVISRTVRDSDDLLKGLNNSERKGYVYNDSAVNYNFGYNWQTQPAPPPGSYYFWLGTTHPDTQPDIFNYNFFGFHGSFVLSQKVSTSGAIKVIKITQDASLITYDETLGTFTVITPEGYKGEFTIKEKSTSFASSIITNDRLNCCSQGNIDIQQVINNGKYRATSTWYLSKITSPRGQIINFNYDLNPDGSSPYLSNSRAFAELDGITSPEVCLQTVQEHVYLKSIVSEEVRVDFAMEFREDLKRNNLFTGGGYFPVSLPLLRFSGLTITGIDPSSTLNKHITFVQRYFNQQFQNGYAELENEVRWMRSRLDRVIIDDQEHRFYYDNGDKGLPDKLTNGIDHFGFYNGEDFTVQLLPPDPESGAFLGSTYTLSDTTNLVFYKQKWNRRVVFSNGKAGLLVKVKYPTRGYSVFEYEPHVYFPDQTGPFIESGTNYGNLAGGARIKTIKEFDYNDTPLLIKSYKYLESATAFPSPTTGRLMTPLYNRYAKRLHNQNPPYGIYGVNYLYKTHSTIPGNNSAEGKVIGYSKVHEIVSGSGGESYTNTYYFENRVNELLTWNAISVSYPNLNGQVMEVRNYDSQGHIVQQLKNQDYHHRVDSVKAIVYEFPSTPTPFLEFVVRYSVPITFNTPYTIITTTSETPSGIVEATDGSISSYGKANQTTETLVYNTTGSDPSYLLRSRQITNSKDEILKTEYKRPSDYAAPHSSITYMKTKNILAPVIEEITTRNGVVISAQASRYERELPSGPRVNLISNFSYNKTLGSFASPTDGYSFTSVYEKTADFVYDAFSGKMKEFKGADGVTNSFIWGYNYKLPIAHGVGITYDQLNTAYNASVGNPNYETMIRNHSSTAAGQVTTYSYKPLVGIVSSINPSLYKKTYQYDAFSRLNKVLDNDGNTLEQYQYHFKELPITRNLSLSISSISFGTFYNCTLPGAKTLTITNSGEDDLNITNFTVPTGFLCPWQGGIIAAGTFIDLPISFTGGTGNYSGQISITSNRTDGPATIAIPVSATYVPSGTLRTISIAPPNPLIFDIQFQSKIVNVTNVGDACLEITGASVNDTQNWSVSITPALIMPGQSTPMTIIRKMATPPVGTPVTPATVTVTSNSNGGTNTLQVNLPTRVISLSTTAFPSFSSASISQVVTVANSGNSPLSITGISSSNGMFTVSPTTLSSIPAGGSQNVTVTFTPTAYNFNLQSATLTFSGTQTSGTNTIGVSAQRTELRTIQLSATSLTFNSTGEQQNVTVSNTGNNYLSITGVTYPSTSNWYASITTANLAPGQSTNLNIVRTGASPETINFTVTSNKNGGNEIVQVAANTRTLGYANTSFPSFSSASYTQNMTVSNSGNSTLNVSNFTSSNSRFTLSPTSFSVAPGGQQTVGITYTPTDFTSQSTSLVLYSDATNYSGSTAINTSGQRTELRTIQLSNTALTFNYTGEQQNVTVSNTGNNYLSITGVTYPSTSNWSASVTTANLAPGQSTNLNVVRTGANPEAINFTVVSNKNGGNEVVQAVANTRILGYANTTFPSFSSATYTQNMTVSNNGNTTMTVSNITSSNSRFTLSPVSFSVAPGGNQTVGITYAATDVNLQSTSLVLYSDATNYSGSTTINTSAQQSQVYQISVSPTSVVVKPSSQIQTVTIYNTGNVNATINGIGNSNPSSFSVTYWKLSGGIFVQFTALPYTITPGSQMQIRVATATSGNYSSASGTITILPNQGSNYIVNMSRTTF
jgi:hypothetical protein